MIDIQIEPAQFEYDVQSLVQAFYTGHPLKLMTGLKIIPENICKI